MSERRYRANGLVFTTDGLMYKDEYMIASWEEIDAIREELAPIKWPKAFLDLVHAKDKLNAIKKLRELEGLGLKEAKETYELVDSIIRTPNSPKQKEQDLPDYTETILKARTDRHTALAEYRSRETPPQEEEG